MIFYGKTYLKKKEVVEKKYKADNGLVSIFWGIFIFALVGYTIYRYYNAESIWVYILYIVFAILFTLSITINEYVITELSFIETRFQLNFLTKNKRIAIGDIVGMKKLKKNQLQLDLVRGFEILRVKESDIDALIAELRDRNPRIKMPEED